MFASETEPIEETEETEPTELTTNEKRRQALLGRTRSLEERARIRTGMRGLSQDDPDWEAAYREDLAQLQREQRILETLAGREGPLVAPEIANHRTQLAKLINDATTTSIAYYLDHQRLVELIEQRNIRPETWAMLEEWLELK